jgi:hypothetical protein
MFIIKYNLFQHLLYIVSTFIIYYFNIYYILFQHLLYIVSTFIIYCLFLFVFDRLLPRLTYIFSIFNHILNVINLLYIISTFITYYFNIYYILFQHLLSNLIINAIR